MKLRALLLAAGYGTRLRPLTLSTPKCLVELAGEPLLGHWLHKLENSGCEAVIVNTHYLSTKVTSYLEKWKKSPMSIETIYEPTLLGTAGSLLSNKSFFRNCTGLLIHADNAMSADISSFLKAHEERLKESNVTMLTFTTTSPETCGIVETDEKGLVVGFHEKKAKPPGNQANGAVYAFENTFISELSKMHPVPSDFSNDVIPKFLGQIQTHHTEAPYLDIGTPTSLKQAQEIWANRLSKGKQ